MRRHDHWTKSRVVPPVLQLPAGGQNIVTTLTASQLIVIFSTKQGDLAHEILVGQIAFLGAWLPTYGPAASRLLSGVHRP